MGLNVIYSMTALTHEAIEKALCQFDKPFLRESLTNNQINVCIENIYILYVLEI